MPFYTGLPCPEEGRVRGELRSVVTDDELRFVEPGDERRQCAGNPLAQDRRVWDRR